MAIAEDTPTSLPDTLPGERKTLVATARSVTAAARRIRPGNKDEVAAIPRRGEAWTGEAWTYHDEVPEVGNVATWVGNNLSRLRLFPAIETSRDEPPVSAQDAAGMSDADGGISQRTADLADAAIDRLSEGPADGMAGHLREWGVCLTISGDSYLVGEDREGEEAWQVYSESAIKRRGDNLVVQDMPSGKGRVLDDNALVVRVWRRHPRYPGVAYSNMRSVLSECEELLIYSRQFRAIGKSRNNAGLLLLPNGLDLPKKAGANGNTELTSIEEGIFTSMTTPTHDDASASSVVPHIIRGSSEALKEIRHVPLDRKIDEKAIERVQFLIARFGNGMNCPVEVVTGVGGLNHWNVWAVQDEAYRSFLEPLAMIPAAGLAVAWLRPVVTEAAAGDATVAADAKRLVMGIDASQLVVRPNRAQDAKDAFDRLGISWEAFRGHLGFGDDDKPTDDELAQRAIMGLGAFHRSGLATPGEAIPGLPAGGDAAAGGGDTQASYSGDANELYAALAKVVGGTFIRERIAITASATPAPVRIDLGARLAGIEVRLRDRLQAFASQAMTDALRLAGQRLRSRAQGDPVTAAATRGLPSHMVASTLGEEQTAELVDVGDLMAGQFDDVASEFDRLTARAQADVADLLTQYAPDDASAQAAVDRYQAHQDRQREVASAALIAALLLLGRNRMFTPDGTPDTGEFDSRMAVPAGLIREALVLAGGGREATTPSTALDDGMAGGVAIGSDALAAMAEAGIAVDTWTWQTGWPDRPFDPHQELEGVEFSDWQADELAYDGWPADMLDGHLFPGDHDGCQCVAIPNTTAAAADDTAPTGSE